MLTNFSRLGGMERSHIDILGVGPGVKDKRPVRFGLLILNVDQGCAGHRCEDLVRFQ